MELAVGRIERAERETKPLGLVWIDSPDSLISLGLKKALEGYARVCRGTRAPVGLKPSLIVVLGAEREIAAEVERARELAPHTPVVVLGSFADFRLAREAMRCGARGFVHAGMPPEQVARALTMASKGETVIPRELLPKLVAQESLREATAELTARQEEILKLVAEGLTNAQIASRLYLSEYTVKQHLRAAYKALGVRNRNQAARLFRQSSPDGVNGHGEM